ncbi:hypothetical protein GCM10025859_25240 [Alicyclobacillus fastidiosus]|nr:hypothetical protein GCM10025859_25240 [Alicyclobacillus fastidiosus]
MTTLGLPRVLILSVPKGGTNLLMQVVLGIPGMVQTGIKSIEWTPQNREIISFNILI